MSRLSHNKRKKSFDKKKMLNMNEVLQDIKVIEDNNQPKPLSKTEITNKISKLTYRLKKYLKQRDDLYGHKFIKKQNQIIKLERNIEQLKIQRKNTASQMNYAKKAYVEFVLTITKAPQAYKKDMEFAKELKRVSILFLEKRFTSDICNIDIHLDQSTPHLHVMGRYIGNNSLQKDLDKNYSKKRFQYSDMQTDFNNFIKDNFDFKKFDKLTIEDITKGGKRNYLPIQDYKALNVELKQKVQKEINKILANTQVITKLLGENQIKESDYHNLLKKYRVVKTHYYFLKQLTNKNEARKMFDDLKKENDALHKKLDDIKNLNSKADLYEGAIKKMFGDEIVNLSNLDFMIAIENKRIAISNFSKQHQTVKKDLKNTKEELERSKKTIIQNKRTIRSLESDISTKDNYINKLKNIIVNSKIPALIDKLKRVIHIQTGIQKDF